MKPTDPCYQNYVQILKEELRPAMGCTEPIAIAYAAAKARAVLGARPDRLLRLNKAYDENGEILFYEITCGTLRLQIMGSLGLDADTAYPTGADWLILPFQGRSDLTEYAMPLVERLAPRGILLDHYDDAFPPMSATVDTAGFVTAAEKRLGIPCRALKKYETLTL